VLSAFSISGFSVSVFQCLIGLFLISAFQIFAFDLLLSAFQVFSFSAFDWLSFSVSECPQSVVSSPALNFEPSEICAFRLSHQELL